jgi:hypothetical protein
MQLDSSGKDTAVLLQLAIAMSACVEVLRELIGSSSRCSGQRACESTWRR